MRFALPLLALASLASAQNATDSAAFAAGLIASLTASGYSSLVNIVTSIGATPEGIKLLGDLQAGERTLLAPSDGALSGVSTNITSNATLLAQVLSYHVLTETYNTSSVSNSPNHTIARTTLQGDVYANIGGGRGQALVLYQTNGTGIQVDAPYEKWVARPYNVSTHGVSTYGNLTIIGLDEVINLPPTVGEFAAQNASTAAAALNSVGMVGPLESLTGLTIFLPTNEAFAKLPPTTIAGLNQSTLITVFQNHVVNNSVLYSTGLGPAVSFAGEALTFAKNGSVLTVTSGNVTANVVYSDIITRNGVIHLIDTVLLNTASNPQAVASVKSVQATATATSTSDIGVGPTSGVVGAGGNASASALASASAAARSAGFVSFSLNKSLVALVLVGAALVWV
ncbi:FAS1 domain-containing protein [Mrakia frigida]|uniref:fasciclin domain-containing protein n=1 Tax=Mrakia frigida TaxID=29902 RepID=UPI003FCC14D4